MAEACYVESYLPGSFKGVGFVTERASSEHGRRGAEGEFPFSEQTAYADLGRKIRKYGITARFDSNNHLLSSAALIAACESSGSGILVHPTRGVIANAACISLKVDDRLEESAGVTEIELQFVEANDWPNGLSLFGNILGVSSLPLITAIRTAFTANFVINAIQAFRSRGVVGAAQAQISSIATQYAAATISDSSSAERNKILFDLRSVASSFDQASNPVIADRAIALGMQAVSQGLPVEDKFEVFRGIANGAAFESSFSSPAAEAENSVYALVRTMASVYMVQGAIESQDRNAGEIFQQIDVIESILRQEMAAARNLCQDELYLELENFLSESMARLSQKVYSAPGLTQYSFGGSVHPLVAAYSIFGDAKRHREIEMENPIGALGRARRNVIVEQ